MQTPETNYLTLTSRSLGFDTIKTNLLVIPANVLFILQLLFWNWFSEKFNQRSFHLDCQPGLGHSLDHRVGDAAPEIYSCELGPLRDLIVNCRLPVCSCYIRYLLENFRRECYVDPADEICKRKVAVTSRNSGSFRTRTMGSSLYNMAVQTSNIVSSHVSYQMSRISKPGSNRKT